MYQIEMIFSALESPECIESNGLFRIDQKRKGEEKMQKQNNGTFDCSRSGAYRLPVGSRLFSIESEVAEGA
jgi:hypothetical protein